MTAKAKLLFALAGIATRDDPTYAERALACIAQMRRTWLKRLSRKCKLK
jgi:hypothetical protein